MPKKGGVLTIIYPRIAARGFLFLGKQEKHCDEARVAHACCSTPPPPRDENATTRVPSFEDFCDCGDHTVKT